MILCNFIKDLLLSVHEGLAIINAACELQLWERVSLPVPLSRPAAAACQAKQRPQQMGAVALRMASPLPAHPGAGVLARAAARLPPREGLQEAAGLGLAARLELLPGEAPPAAAKVLLGSFLAPVALQAALGL